MWELQFVMCVITDHYNYIYMLSSLPCLVLLPYAERVELYRPKHGHGILIQIDIIQIQKRTSL